MQQTTTERTPEDNWSFCNLNRKCPIYWKLEECVKAQKEGKCQKHPI
jgi:hypothetical protein